MKFAAGVFVGEVTDNGFMPNWSYRIDANGIQQRPPRSPHPWADMLSVEAWLTTTNGDWNTDELEHLRLTYSYGYELQLNDDDSSQFSFFTDVEKAVAHYLDVKIDWRGGELAAEYQLRRQRWPGGWLGGRNKPVVYAQGA